MVAQFARGFGPARAGTDQHRCGARWDGGEPVDQRVDQELIGAEVSRHPYLGVVGDGGRDVGLHVIPGR